MDILALNCGSSSVKYQLFDWERKEVIAKGMVERVIIGDSFILHEVPGRETYREQSECPDHQVAINLIIKTLTDDGHGVLKDINQISAVGHRVVHGGSKFTSSVVITPQVIGEIEALSVFAPLHNPVNLDGIRIAMQRLPGVLTARQPSVFMVEVKLEGGPGVLPGSSARAVVRLMPSGPLPFGTLALEEM